MNDVTVKIGANTSELNTGLGKADNAVRQFEQNSTKVTGLAGAFKNVSNAGGMAGKAIQGFQAALGPVMAVIGAFVGMKSLAEAAGQIDDLSQRFGESAETIQRVKYAADQSGTSIETVAKSMNKAELAAVAAASGNEEMNKAFQELGISAEEFAGLSMEERLAKIGEGYDGNTNKAAALAAMVRIMGKNAGELIPLFAQGGDAITEMMNRASVASSDSIGRIAQVEDRFGGMFSTLKTWAFEAIGFVIDLIDKMSIGIASAIAFVSNLGDGIDSAKQAYEDTLNAGLDLAEEQKKQREERNNKISSANIEQIKEETKQETDKKADEDSSKETAKKAEKENSDYDSYFQTIEDAKKDAANKSIEEKRKKDEDKKKADKKKKQSGLENNLDVAQDVLTDLKGRNKANNSDQLRKIGGGFSKANYQNISKESIALQKQIDLQQKTVDEIKKVVEALKSGDSTDGITG